MTRPDDETPQEYLEASSPNDEEAPLDLANRLALRPKEAAQVLGVSERTLRSMLPELPHFRQGGAVLLPIDSLRDWLREKAQTQDKRVDAVVKEVLDDLGPFNG